MSYAWVLSSRVKSFRCARGQHAQCQGSCRWRSRSWDCGCRCHSLLEPEIAHLPLVGDPVAANTQTTKDAEV